MNAYDEQIWRRVTTYLSTYWWNTGRREYLEAMELVWKLNDPEGYKAVLAGI